MAAISLISLQILLVVYYCYFSFYNYLYSLASLFNYKFKTAPLNGKKVAVVIVCFNEYEVIQDTIRSCEMLTYDNKMIIVGDDSNDDKTYDLLLNIADSKGCMKLTTEHPTYESETFVLFHRKHNYGFKAGNLKELEQYLKSNDFDYMYLLDADWRPQKDVIEKCLAVMEADEKIAFVQTKRIYSRSNFLEKCLALSEEACYFVDMPGRQSMGDPILFTGCCALFRLKALFAVGGFQPGHLTEDIDLTNRIYLQGYKGVYLQDAINEGEVPPNYKSFRKQQERWVMGSARSLKDHSLSILCSRVLTLRQKLGLLRQNAYFTSSVVIELSIIFAFISIIFLLLSTVDNFQATMYLYYLNSYEIPLSILVFFALLSNFIPLLITVCKRKSFQDLVLIPYATWLSWSVLHTTCIANIKGFFGFHSEWFKTPKTNRTHTAKKLSMEGSNAIRFFNFLTLAILIFIYSVEWVYFGLFDIYALFWIPALTIGILLS